MKSEPVQANRFNYARLRAKTVELGKTDKEVAVAGKMTPSTYSLKLNNKGVFTQEQIVDICNFLLIAYCDIPLYFLPSKFSFTKLLR